MYKLKYHKRVVKFINSRNPQEKRRIKDKFIQLMENPYPTNTQIDIKNMINRNGYRLRVGNYRFIYDIVEDELIIYVEYAGNRGDIY
ncbi:type II toxin-antitoxin system RelE/ParE family toxin [Thiotrichales bacterium HSG1]|nr:type II toxin-antitoxin system RelE/ParE family toxin [Thiotrichales bacterium HSG1]